MIRLGTYVIHRETLSTTLRALWDNLGVRIFGVPRLRYSSLPKLARAVLRRNIQRNRLVLAGWGHFRLMWVADTAIAFEGLRHVSSKRTIRQIIQHIIDASWKRGFVTAGFSLTRAIDIPYQRGDSLPWLLYMCDKYATWYNDRALIAKNRAKLQTFIAAYEKQTIGDNGMVRSSIRGDWADTIRRPSSAWNNIMALFTLRFAKKYRFQLTRLPKNFEELLLTNRLSGDYLLDHEGSVLPSVDGTILALYLGVFTKTVRRRLAKHLAKTMPAVFPSVATAEQFPKALLTRVARIFAPGYHTSASWLHLGLMMVNGYKKLGLKHKKELKKIEELVEKYGNFIETVNQKGEIFKSTIASEYGFTMSAGQYLEAVKK